MALLDEIEAFLRSTGMSATAFGKEVAKDPRFVHDLRKGRDPKMSTAESVRDWIARYSAPTADAA
jgi:hypothetical protein